MTNHFLLCRRIFAAIAVAAMSVTSAASDRSAAVAQLQTQSSDIAQAVKSLDLRKDEGFDALGRAGEAIRDLPKMDALELEKMRVELVAEVFDVLRFRKPLAQVQDEGKGFLAQLSVLRPRLADMLKGLSADPKAREQVKNVSRLSFLVDRMQREVPAFDKGNEGGQHPADDLQRDVEMFNAISAGLLNGDDDLGIPAVTQAAAKSVLGDVIDQWTTMQSLAADLINETPDMQDLSRALSKLKTDNAALQARCAALLAQPAR